MRKSIGLVQPEEKALGKPLKAFQYSIRAYKHFSMTCCNRIRGDDIKLKEGRFRYKEETIKRMVKNWQMLPREVVDIPPLRTFRALSKLFWLEEAPSMPEGSG